MWEIKDVKRKARKLFKKNMWTFIFLAVFMTFFIGKNTLTKDSLKNIQTTADSAKKLKEQIKEEPHLDLDINNLADLDKLKELYDSEEEKKIINDYLDKLASRAITHDTRGVSKIINDYNKEKNVYKGFIFTVYQMIVDTFKNLREAIANLIKNADRVVLINIIMSCILLGMATLKIFVKNPIAVGENRVYLETLHYPATDISRILYVFKKGNYWNIVKTTFMVWLYQFLWNLTIVGGIIKHYSYKMVPYIIAENPSLSPNEAITLSRDMMYGNKLKAFLLDLTYIPWNILQVITFGIAGIYVIPYYNSCYTIMYTELRKKFTNVLNDELLFDNKNFYGNYKENEQVLKEDKKSKKNGKRKEEKKVQKKAKDIDNIKYSWKTIILLFFFFSMLGWLWEVTLFLFQDGKFVNRGVMYGPWLPIYGAGCTLIIVVAQLFELKKAKKNPVLMFLFVMVICTIMEYLTSFYIEAKTGIRYWDYNGVFMNINTRVCLEASMFFGIGGTICLYFIGPFFKEKINKLSNKMVTILLIVLITAFVSDSLYSQKHPHEGQGITSISEKKLESNDKEANKEEQQKEQIKEEVKEVKEQIKEEEKVQA